MNEELQKLMGDSYKEGLTVEDIANFMKGKSFVDLSKGGYVDVNKYNKEIGELNTKLTEKDKVIQSKMSDDELAQQAQKDKDAEIERLKKLLSDNTITTNKSLANSSLVEGLGLLGMKSDDSEFVKFMDDITSEDGTKTSSIAQYVNKLIKNAYEKGKKDSTKDAMGNFGKQQGGSNPVSGEPEIGKLGKELAQQSVNKKKFDYFAEK